MASPIPEDARPIAQPMRPTPTLSECEFETIRALLHRSTGIALSPVKREMVYGRLARRLRALALPSFAAYLDHLRHDPTEWDHFVAALTTPHTRFFREPHHFDFLRTFLPMRREEPIRIWSAGTASGEEAYSIAITACETFASLTPPVAIVASDINRHALAIAEAGGYTAEQLAPLAPALRECYFAPEGGLFWVRAPLRQMIKFISINLIAPDYPFTEPFAAIFCRNVMIYFDPPTRRQILEKFHRHLVPDGLLFVGHAEPLLADRDLFAPVGQNIFRPLLS